MFSKIGEIGWIFWLVVFQSFSTEIFGHGRLLKPVSRSSRWRYDARAPTNFNDNELFCGGFSTQWYVNGGKCGLCGDDYRLSTPRPNENGGSYGLGVIVGLYKVGAQIPVSVYLTANHKGYFLFDMCNLEQKNAIESDECFGKNKLKLSNGADRYSVPNTSTGWFNTTLQLPNELSCSQCVLRWTWIVGNSWGNCGNGTEAVGCGPQETFRGCSDVRIVRNLKTPKRKIIVPPMKPSTIFKLKQSQKD